MYKAVFEAHLLDLLLENGLDACKCKYMISPVYEEGKKYTSKDDFMRLNVFPTDKIKDKIYSFDEAVQRFSVLEPYYPIWIDVYVKEPGVIELMTSMRYRRPSELGEEKQEENLLCLLERANDIAWEKIDFIYWHRWFYIGSEK